MLALKRPLGGPGEGEGEGEGKWIVVLGGEAFWGRKSPACEAGLALRMVFQNVATSPILRYSFTTSGIG